MSLFSPKTVGGQGGVQPWSQALTLFPGSGNVDALFNFYTSLGDVTLTGANTVSTVLDGPEKVVRYGNLVLGDGTTATSLTAANRCKGLVILCDTLTVKNNATLNMTGRGARVLTNDDPFYPFVDFKIPTQIVLSSSLVGLQQALGVIRANGFAPWDSGTWAARVAPLFGFTLAVSQDGTATLLSAVGCGDGGNGQSCSATAYPGLTGGAGTNGGMGGGGSGRVYASGAATYTAKAGKGCPYSGGSGGAGSYNGGTANMMQAPPPSNYSGRGGAALWASALTTMYSDPSSTSGTMSGGGGGAGNPGGLGGYAYGSPGSDGTGGKLVIIARTSITVLSGGKIEANGMPGGASSVAGGGGGSGGGHVSIITPTLTNNGTIQAVGGAAGIGAGSNGGAGGAGSVITKTCAGMGW